MPVVALLLLAIENLKLILLICSLFYLCQTSCKSSKGFFRCRFFSQNPNPVPIPWLNPTLPGIFPATKTAARSPNGLLAAGGALTSEWLISAYRQGIFPWFNEGEPPLWWSPTPRLVLFAGEAQANARLLRTLRSCDWQFSTNVDFAGVLQGCAAPRDEAGTWLTYALQSALIELHGLGYAHSLEVFDKNQRIAGIYGIAIGKIFFAESMFGSRSNASKAALLSLSTGLAQLGFVLMDCQVRSAHLMARGAREISRTAFEAILAKATQQSCDWPEIWPIADTRALALALAQGPAPAQGTAPAPAKA